MARRPQFTQKLFDFTPRPNDEAEDHIPPHTDGDHHDVQDDLPGAAGAAPGNLRPAPPAPDAPADAEPSGQPTESPSPRLDTGTSGNPAGQRQPDSQRSDGAGLKRTGG